MAEGRGKKDDTVEYLVDFDEENEKYLKESEISTEEINKENAAILCTGAPFREQRKLINDAVTVMRSEKQ